MNIVFLIGELRGGGAEGVVATLCSDLANKGHTITLISHLEGIAYNISEKVIIADARDWQYNTAEGGLLQRLYKKTANRFLDLMNIKKIIRQQNPDIVISFLVAWLWQVILICKGKCPIVCAERNAMVYPHTGRNFWNKQVLYRFADVVQVMSKYDKAWLRNRYKRVVSMPNPLRFSPMSSEVYKLVFGNRRNILACGRVNPQKGFEKLIIAFSLVSSRFADWDVDICGGYDENDAYYKQLNNLIVEKGLQGRVNFIGFHKDIEEVMKKHAIFCLSSQHEGFPNVLSEAMANGLACISYDIVTGPSEIIIDGLDGIIVEDQSIDELSKGLSKFMSDKDLRYSLGLKAIENIKRYGRDRIVDKWEGLFYSIITK